MYYPLSQIKTNLYTNGQEFSLSENYTETDIYIGYYWTDSRNKSYTGKTPQDTPTRRLYPLSQKSPKGDFNNYSITDSYLIVNQPTIFLDEFDEIIDKNNTFYANFKNIPLTQKKVIPYYSPVLPIENDYKIGEFRRYFCKKTNELIYIEINKDLYDKLINKDQTIIYEYYIPFNISWQLTGNKEQTYKINKNIVELIIKKQNLFMFNKYLQDDYLKYYKNTV